MNLKGPRVPQLCLHFAHEPTSIGEIFKGSFLCFYCKVYLEIVQNIEKGIYFLTRKLFLVENDLFPRYKTMNNKTKEIGE